MTRHIKAGRRRIAAHGFLLSAAIAAVTLLSSRAWAIGLRYVEADDLAGNIAPLSAVNGGAAVNDDVLWGFRGTFGANGTIFESGRNENSPTLTQTLTGLTPGKSYDVYGVFWTDKDENWTMQAGTDKVEDGKAKVILEAPEKEPLRLELLADKQGTAVLIAAPNPVPRGTGPGQKLGGVMQKRTVAGSVPVLAFQCGTRDGNVITSPSRRT